MNRPNIGNNVVINNTTVVNNRTDQRNNYRDRRSRYYHQRPYYSSLHNHWGPTGWYRYSYRPAFYNYYGSGISLGYSFGAVQLGYVNPFWAPRTAVTVHVLDYSRPIAVPRPDHAETAEELVRSEQAIRLFDAARGQFAAANYAAAVALVDESIVLLPGDPTFHQFRALVLFAQGRFGEAAAGIHAVLAVSPGWDWDTIGSLYGAPEPYEAHFQALAQHVRENPDQNDARFLLAYHCMVLGEDQAASNLLTAVRIANPQDRVTLDLLASLQDGL